MREIVGRAISDVHAHKAERNISFDFLRREAAEKAKQEQIAHTKVLVENLPEKVDSEEELKKLFQPFGRVSARVMKTIPPNTHAHTRTQRDKRIVLFYCTFSVVLRATWNVVVCIAADGSFVDLFLVVGCPVHVIRSERWSFAKTRLGGLRARAMFSSCMPRMQRKQSTA